MTSDSTAKFEEPQLYDVWRMPFEYEDQPGVFKNRLVIVGGIDEESVEVFVLSIKVTSHPPRPNYFGEVPILDCERSRSIQTFNSVVFTYCSIT